MVNINNTELQNMTYNGQEVNTWIHNGVEVFSNIDITNRVKYLITFSNATNEPVNIKKYSMKYGIVIEETNINASVNYAPTPYYEDDYFTIGRFNYTGVPTKWLFTPKVEGLSTVIVGMINYGTDFGGTVEQIAPNLTSGNCTMMFEPSDIGIKYVPGLLDAEWTFTQSHTHYSYDHSVSESEIMVKAKKVQDNYVAYATGTMTATFDTKGYNRVRLKVEGTSYSDNVPTSPGSVNSSETFPYCETINDVIYHSQYGHSHYLHFDCGDSDKFIINLSATDGTNYYWSTVKLTEIAFYKDKNYSLNGDDIEVFNADIADPNANYLGFTENSRALNSEYLSYVTAPITNNNSTTEKNVLAYSPTDKAIEKYKYVWISFYKHISTLYDSGKLMILNKGGVSAIDYKLIHCTNAQYPANNGYLETIRVNLDTNTKIYSKLNGISENTPRCANLAISRIKLANDPEFWKKLLNGRELEDIVEEGLGSTYADAVRSGYWLIYSYTINNKTRYRLLFSQTPMSYANDGSTFYSNYGSESVGKCGAITFDVVNGVLVLDVTVGSYEIYDLPAQGRVLSDTGSYSYSNMLYSNFDVYTGKYEGGKYMNTTTLYYSPL